LFGSFDPLPVILTLIKINYSPNSMLIILIEIASVYVTIYESVFTFARSQLNNK
jgi:hypothetical protein